ncbi:MAG: hypothetical protein ACI8XU_002766, partial [Kiritimatiellia bacterium]
LLVCWIFYTVMTSYDNDEQTNGGGPQ